MLQKTKLIKIILPSETIGVTIYDRPLNVHGQIYKQNYNIEPIILRKMANFAPEIATIRLLLTQKKLLGGVLEIYDYDLELMEQKMIFSGTITACENYDLITEIEAQSVKRHFNKNITRTFGRECQALWGDSRCGIDKNNYSQIINIDNITDNTVFYSIISGNSQLEFYQPYIEIQNLDQKITIYNLDPVNQHFECDFLDYFTLNHQVILFAGCNKTNNNCNNYSNLINYLGFY